MAHILIVDDQKSVLILLESLLSGEGHVVTSCLNPIDAMDKLNSERFDLMITDAIMPGNATGYSLTKTVKSLEKFAHLPIIMLTGKREREDVEKGIEVGVDDYVVKPVDPELLLAKIRNLLKGTEQSKNQFFEAPVKVKAEWETKTEIIGVSELGFTVKSNVPMPLGLSLRLTTTLYKDIGISNVPVRIVSCEEIQTGEKYYKVMAYFIGLSEKELNPLRLWIRSSKTY